MARDVSTNAEMQAVINAGGVVTYDGRIIRKIADLPTDEQILADFPEYSYTFNVGNARGILGYQITGTPADQDTLIFDGTEKKWTLGASSGGGGGSINIREVDGTPTITGASVLEFDQGDGFIVSNPSGSIARVRINAIPDARLTSNVTLGGNTFSGTGSMVRASSPTITTPTIAKLANLTTNGFVKTSGSDGTLSVDTNTYLTSSGAVTSLSGTTNQITASASTGAVTLSLPSSPHIAGTLFVGSTSGIQFGDGGGISGATTGFITPVSDGVFRFGDSAGGGSPHIIFGSNNSGFVRIKRNGTSLAVRLGDDSADGNITAANGTFTGILTTGSASTTLTDSAGKILSAALNTVGVAQGGTGLTALGSALQVLRVNSGGTALEFANAGSGSQTPWTANVYSDGFNLLVDDGTGILSSESTNPKIQTFSSVANAVNWITATNSANNNSVILGTDGSSTAVRLRLSPKGGSYPDGPSVEFVSGVRYDNPEISWVGLPAYGIHQNSGGGWMSINCSNLALGAGGAQGGSEKVVAMLKNTILAWSDSVATPIDDVDQDLFVGKRAAANIRLGRKDVDLNSAIVAQTLSVQGALTGGTSDQAGKNFTIDLSQSKGTGAGGGLVIRATPASGSSSSTLNSYTTVLTIPSVGGVVMPAITAPSTPSANNVHFYAKVNGLYYKGENGTEVGPLGAGGGGSLTDGDKGDITVSSSGSVWTIDNTAVSYAKIQNVTDNKLLGRSAGSNGSVQEITIGSGLSLSSGTLTASGGGGGTTINSTDTVIPYRSDASTFSNSPLSVASSAVTLTRTSVGVTSSDGFILANTTAAANNAQQWSPRVRFAGLGWSSTNSASRPVDFIQELQTVQGTSNPSGLLVFSSQVNGGGYTAGLTISSSNYVQVPGGNSETQPGLIVGNFTQQGLYANSGGGWMLAIPANNFGVHGSGVTLLQNAGFRWSDNPTSIPTGNLTTGMHQDAAGRVEINNGTKGTWRDLKVRQHYVDATLTSGGTTGAQTINKAAGSVNFASNSSSLVVTNSLATTTSLIFCTVLTNDTTAQIKNVVRASGSFTINLVANTTAETVVGFHIIGT